MSWPQGRAREQRALWHGDPVLCRCAPSVGAIRWAHPPCRPRLLVLPTWSTGKQSFFKESFYLHKNQHSREGTVQMVLISRGHMFGGTPGTPTRILCFLNVPFQRCSGGLLFAGGCCFLPLVHSRHVCSVPSLRPLLLAERRSWINSDHNRLQPSSAFQRECRHGETLPEPPVTGRRSCCSLHASTHVTLAPPRWASKHTGSGGANCKRVSSLFSTGLGNLVIWELWVCLLAGLSYERGLEVFVAALVPALPTFCLSLLGVYEKGIYLISYAASLLAHPKRAC